MSVYVKDEWQWADYVMMELPVTDDESEWAGENSEVCLVDDKNAVRRALAEDYENAESYDVYGHPITEIDEDVCGFLDRHGIAWR